MTIWSTGTRCDCPDLEPGMGGKRAKVCEKHQHPYFSLKAGGNAESGSGSRPLPGPERPIGGRAPGSKAPGPSGRTSQEKVGVASNLHPRRKGLKRTRRRETAAEKRARLHFNATVKARKCWFAWHRRCELCEGAGEVAKNFGIGSPGLPEIVQCPACDGDGRHHCSGRKDAHHLVPKDFLRKRFSRLPEDQLLAILFNPLIGAPLCRKAHDRIEASFDRIYWEDLTEECVEYVFSLPDFVVLRLEEECPKRPGERREERERSVAA